MKNNKLIYLLGLLVIIFTALSFFIPFQHTDTFWTAFIFGIFAFAAQILFYNKSFGNAESLISKLYAFPIAKIGLIYLSIQVVVSLVFMAIAHVVSMRWPFLAGIILAALAGIGLIATDEARSIIEKQEIIVPDRTVRITKLRNEANALLSSIKDPELKIEVQKICEAIRYSDPVTGAGLEETDDALLTSIKEIRREPKLIAVKTFVEQLEERNRLCRSMK